MARKSPELADAIGEFGAQLIRASHKPNINRYTPLPAQEIFHKTQTRHRVVKGGNRGGKTFSSVADDVLVALRRHPYRQHLYPDRPLIGRFIGVDFERGIAQGALPLFQQFMPPSALINGAWEDSYRASERMLYLADGGKISFMSYEQDPDKFQIVALDWVHFDEEPPKPIYDESRLRLLDSDGCMSISMTPVQQMEWLQDEVIEPALDGTLANWSVVDLDTRDNIHLSQRAVAELGEGLSEDQKKIRYEGQYLSGSLVFPEFSRKFPNVIPQQPISRFRPELGWQIFESMDYGYANPTSWEWTAVHHDGSIVTLIVLYQAQVVIEQWAARVHHVRGVIREALGDPDWMPAMTVGDPSIGQKNNGQSGLTNQQAYAQLGIGIATEGIVGIRTGNQNVGLDRMHTYLRLRPAAAGPSSGNGMYEMPWWQIMENDTDFGEFPANNQALISELRKARKPKQTLKTAEVQNVSEAIRDKDNHAIDAAKYLFMMLPDLRPEQFRDLDVSAVPGLVIAQTRAAGPPPATHEEAWYATNSTDTSRRGASTYSQLEGS